MVARTFRNPRLNLPPLTPVLWFPEIANPAPKRGATVKPSAARMSRIALSCREQSVAWIGHPAFES
jgi:hypothetical protein